MPKVACPVGSMAMVFRFIMGLVLLGSRMSLCRKHPTPWTACAPVARSKATAPYAPSECMKLIYLHIPRCGGFAVTSVFALTAAKGFEFLRPSSYSFDELYGQELHRPTARKKLLMTEIGSNQEPSLTLHKRVLELQAVYRRAGCKVALATLYREPEALAASWQSHCSNGRVDKARHATLPGYWAWTLAFQRDNLMMSWLVDGSDSSGGVCGQKPAQLTDSKGADRQRRSTQ